MKKLMFGLSVLAASTLVEAGVVADAVKPWIDNGELAGAISIAYNDGVEEIDCMGYADVAAKRPITLDSVFMQCSQTKGFCGVTIAMLVDEGKLKLDDPVHKYLPEFRTLWIDGGVSNDVKTLKKAKNVLTVRMVMNHTGGFSFEIPPKLNTFKGGGWTRGAPLRAAAVIAAMQPLLFEPGTKAEYSNTGINIGAAIVEVVSGKPWDVFLKERLLDPLGMKDTTFWPTEEQQSRLIELYSYAHGKPAIHRHEVMWQQRPYNDRLVFASAGAGLWTTARDQIKFYKMLMNLGVTENGTRLLKEETVKELLAVSTRPPAMNGYSLGLDAPVHQRDDGWFGHGGAWDSDGRVNWYRRQVKIWVVQLLDKPRWPNPPPKWNTARDKALDAFFKKKTTLTHKEKNVSWTYDLLGGNAIITQTAGLSGDVVVPERLTDPRTPSVSYPVTEIDNAAFRNNASIVSVTLPTSVVRIKDGAKNPQGHGGLGAFSGCTSLTNVVMPKVTHVGAFSFVGASGLRAVNMPEVETIGDLAFHQCKNFSGDLKVLKLKKVGNYSFSETAVTSIEMPRIVRLPEKAFAFCSKLTNSVMPNVEWIGHSSFLRCSIGGDLCLKKLEYAGINAFGDNKLTSVNLPMLKVADGVSWGDGAFIRCREMTNAVLPKVETIGGCCFSGCGKLENINMPNVQKIGEHAFEGCTKLKGKIDIK